MVKAAAILVGLALAMMASRVPAPEPELSVRLADSLRVEVSLSAEGWLAPRRISIYRSTSRFDRDPDTFALPVTVREFLRVGTGEGVLAFEDTMVAHNARYFYRARLELPDGSVSWTGMDSVDTPDASLGAITGSSLLVDKLNYFLAVRCGGVTRKRYPVALGRRPQERKLHQDNATTPEGIYRIGSEQPQARFYKAFDLDYPSLADRTRYRFALEQGLVPKQGGAPAGIGGEIQIHGEGIGSNWTHGCIALRNEDIDELFAHPRVGRGMPVYVVGSELTRLDIQSIKDYRPKLELQAFQRRLAELGLYEGRIDGEVGRGMRVALAAFQHRRGLPVTAELDRRTVAELRQPAGPD
ncbi:MAG: L,D-transpeptidase family protein [bacterium]